MAKSIQDATMDGTLDNIALSTIMHVCTTEPANYAGIAALSLGSVVLAGGDFTKADDVSGRKVTIGAKSLTATGTGTPGHIVLATTSGTILRCATTCTGPGITTSSTVNIPAWKVNLQDPT